MLKSFAILALSIPGLAWGAVKSDRMEVPAGSPRTEALFRAKYQVDCEPDAPFKGLTATASYANRKIRFDLFEARSEVEFQLGTPRKAEVLSYEIAAMEKCRLLSIDPKIELVDTTRLSTIESLVLSHSPFVGIRDDQFRNRLTDLPLTTVYTTETDSSGNLRIKYTTFFSDEDSVGSASGEQEHLSRYGRRLDIEWIYEVTIGPNGRVIAEAYQGGIKEVGAESVEGQSDLGHTRSRFNGGYLYGSATHPITYVVEKKNVVSGKSDSELQRGQLTGYHLVPRIEVMRPQARERVIFEREPWMLQVSDDELARERKLLGRAESYLYALIRGELATSAPKDTVAAFFRLFQGFSIQLKLTEGTIALSGGGKGDIDRLGEDMWFEETYSGIPMGTDSKGFDRLLQLGDANNSSVHGKLTLVGKNKPTGKIDELRFFRLDRSGKNLKLVEITRAFKNCTYGELSLVSCDF